MKTRRPSSSESRNSSPVRILLLLLSLVLLVVQAQGAEAAPEIKERSRRRPRSARGDRPDDDRVVAAAQDVVYVADDVRDRIAQDRHPMRLLGGYPRELVGRRARELQS